MKRVGIFSGTFDPIHNGHLAFAHEALKKAQLDKIFFMVEPSPRRKQGVRALEHRIKMVQLALRNEPQFATIALDHAQFDAATTLPLLQARFKGAELYMLMGDDMLLTHFISWPHVDSLIASVYFLIGARMATAEVVAAHVKQIEKTKGLQFHYLIIQAKHTNVSSGSVRRSLRQGRLTPDIDPRVAVYIKQQQLYHA
jgi:nicotinate-nucleotide adenylyltransferase